MFLGLFKGSCWNAWSNPTVAEINDCTRPWQSCLILKHICKHSSFIIIFILKTHGTAILRPQRSEGHKMAVP